MLTSFALFQSSPVPEDGCNFASGKRNLWVVAVSILTRPGGRVQLSLAPARSWFMGFQSSPVPEDGCN